MYVVKFCAVLLFLVTQSLAAPYKLPPSCGYDVRKRTSMYSIPNRYIFMF